MSDIGDDYDAAVILVEQAEDRLMAKLGDEEARKHKLVGYLFLEPHEHAEKAWQELLRSFSRDPNQPGNVIGDMEITYALTMYLVALEVDLGERPTAQQVGQKARTATSHPDFDDDDIPF